MQASDGALIRGPMRPRVRTSQRPPEARRPELLPNSSPSKPGGWLSRAEPTLYQRCLAVHIYYAGPRSALS
jgi:hypothetical protein